MAALMRLGTGQRAGGSASDNFALPAPAPAGPPLKTLQFVTPHAGHESRRACGFGNAGTLIHAFRRRPAFPLCLYDSSRSSIVATVASIRTDRSASHETCLRADRTEGHIGRPT